ncbi:hypothetical protein GRX01_05530 [Halobaculum sp. WSA2]|uniref:Uncharacterized protein n=1 Tax=Halobaculum saliterrae TaxID=2073113 RepID=A0A6B0SVW4_9EURY|nr:hypothetical protein [Halobaculum saliterrae]MXR40801.1 hypothetical protein [Halobaculum saliterrae]
MRRTVTGCAFCDAGPGVDVGDAHTWGVDDLVTHPICVDCAVRERTAQRADLVACDGCGLGLDTAAALTSFRVEVGRLDGVIQLCGECSPDGPATHWTRDPEDHAVQFADSSTANGSDRR